MEERWDCQNNAPRQQSRGAGIFFQTTTQALSWYLKWDPMPQMNQDIPLTWRQALTLVTVDGTRFTALEWKIVEVYGSNPSLLLSSFMAGEAQKSALQTKIPIIFGEATGICTFEPCHHWLTLRSTLIARRCLVVLPVQTAICVHGWGKLRQTQESYVDRQPNLEGGTQLLDGMWDLPDKAQEEKGASHYFYEGVDTS